MNYFTAAITEEDAVGKEMPTIVIDTTAKTEPQIISESSVTTTTNAEHAVVADNAAEVSTTEGVSSLP